MIKIMSSDTVYSASIMNPQNNKLINMNGKGK